MQQNQLSSSSSSKKRRGVRFLVMVRVPLRVTAAVAEEKQLSMIKTKQEKSSERGQTHPGLFTRFSPLSPDGSILS